MGDGENNTLLLKRGTQMIKMVMIFTYLCYLSQNTLNTQKTLTTCAAVVRVSRTTQNPSTFYLPPFTSLLLFLLF
jgi:hypothetical protein